MTRHLSSLLAFAALTGVATAQPTQTLRIQAGLDRTRAAVVPRTDSAVRSFARRFEALTSTVREGRQRGRPAWNGPSLTPPMRVELVPTVRATGTRAASAEIVLSFDTTGTRAYPATYRDFLQSVFDGAKATMNLVFGAPAVGGTVRVANYDADIGDRDAVAGGYFLPDNGSGQREIRFPIYLSAEAAAVNFVHTLLLAYQGDIPYGFDAFQEGLVRAAAMRVVRTPAAMPGLDQGAIADVLSNTYDVGAHYDWYNQRSLAAKRFIAPNLRDTPLPAGGSIGGIFLMRYLMAGSAWSKVLAEYPTFVAEFNAGVRAQPALANDPSGLAALGQTVLTRLRPGDPTVEGMPFPDWLARQFVLQTRDTRGLKLHLAPLPITSGLAGGDFGVYDVQATYFATDEGGAERLLRATTYPIFWSPSFDRLFPDSQSERMEIVAAYGSVAPNFPNENAGVAYRVSIDLPIQDQIARVHVPAGSVAVPGGRVSDFYGTVEGVPTPVGTTLSVRATVGATAVGTVPVTNGAFGVRFATSTWLGQRSVKLEVLRTVGGVVSVVHTRRVNKAPGALAVDLRVDGEDVQAVALPKGLSLLGFPVEPFASDHAAALGVSSSQLLVARYDSSVGGYALGEQVEPFQLGHAYFVRSAVEKTAQVPGAVAPPSTPWSVALRPGWNLIATPLRSVGSTTSVLVTRGAGFPTTFAEAKGVDIGSEFFAFVRGAADPASGVPETGVFNAATSFAPGQGYYVRCLAAEGATLTFMPSATSGRPAHDAPRPVWRLRVTATDGKTTQSAFLAMSPTATRGFDPREDSGLPPSMGGLRVASVGTEALYRDVRPASSADTYTVRLDNLAAGRAYALNFVEELARAKQVSVSVNGGSPTVFTGVGRRLFVANAASAVLTVKVVR